MPATAPGDTSVIVTRRKAIPARATRCSSPRPASCSSCGRRGSSTGHRLRRPRPRTGRCRARRGRRDRPSGCCRTPRRGPVAATAPETSWLRSRPSQRPHRLRLIAVAAPLLAVTDTHGFEARSLSIGWITTSCATAGAAAPKRSTDTMPTVARTWRVGADPGFASHGNLLRLGHEARRRTGSLCPQVCPS